MKWRCVPKGKFEGGVSYSLSLILETCKYLTGLTPYLSLLVVLRQRKAYTLARWQAFPSMVLNGALKKDSSGLCICESKKTESVDLSLLRHNMCVDIRLKCIAFCYNPALDA